MPPSPPSTSKPRKCYIHLPTMWHSVVETCAEMQFSPIIDFCPRKTTKPSEGRRNARPPHCPGRLPLRLMDGHPRTTECTESDYRATAISINSHPMTSIVQCEQGADTSRLDVVSAEVSAEADIGRTFTPVHQCRCHLPSALAWLIHTRPHPSDTASYYSKAGPDGSHRRHEVTRKQCGSLY
jgi:hypothetical protein